MDRTVCEHFVPEGLACSACGAPVPVTVLGMRESLAEIERLRAELAACSEDAERYRAFRFAVANDITPDYIGVIVDDPSPDLIERDMDKLTDRLIEQLAARKGEEE